MVAPRTIDAPCALCGDADAKPVWTTRDRALGVPGTYTVVRCQGCGFFYQRPRVCDEDLAACYPDNYPRHQEPTPRLPLKGSESRLRAVRWALAARLGYTALLDPRPRLRTRVRGMILLPRLRWDCPPRIGHGRCLDVGCGSGATLGLMRSLGWTTAGIEVDAAAAEKARQFADTVWTGDALSAPFPPGQFDMVTAFHVLEHVPDPVALVRRMLDWLSPGGLLIIEVPNAGGLGASVFGSAWSGLELPRHLSHFTPGSLARSVQQAGGQIAWCWHRTKPRHYLWSLRILLREQGWPAAAHLTETRIVYGMLKLFLELTVPLVSRARLGEVIRVGIHRDGRAVHPRLPSGSAKAFQI